MLKWLFSGMVITAVLFGLLGGRMAQVTGAALRDCGRAVELVISLTGSLCLWSGLMKVGERAGLTRWLSRLCAPVIRRLFPGLDCHGPAANAITINLAANLIGLGNAATPTGLAAMRELEKEQGKSPHASNHMVLFVVLNTASLQLLPTTNALLRANTGAAAPLDILPAVWAASFCSVAVGVLTAKLLGGRRPPGKGEKG